MGGGERDGSGGLTRRQLLGALAAGGLSLAGRPGRAAPAPPSAPPRRAPNLLVILADNHRHDAFGAAGHPWVETPALDALARDGVTFPDAFCTTPLCSPARASLLTGQYAWRHGVRNHTTQARWSPASRTFFEPLHEAGYATAFVGKWHMPGSPPPRLRGVDHFATFTVHEGQGRYFDCPLLVDGRAEGSRRRYLTEELTDRALDFVERHRRRPFCVVLSHKAVHHPWRPAAEDVGRYRDAPVELPEEADAWTGVADGQIFGGVTQPLAGAVREYMETVTSLDREIGRLLAALDALGLGPDTAVLYTSDNGFLFGEHRRVELRWPYEEVLRVPLLLRWPGGGLPAGRRQAMALLIDLAPTLLGLAGLPTPPSVQGTSLLPVLRDPGRAGRRAWLVENTREFPYPTPSYQGVRTREHLYVEFEGRFPPALHDVARDPRQRRNLMGTREGERVLPELRSLLAALRRGERFDEPA